MPECNLILAGMNDINITSNSIFIVVYFAWVGINLVDLKECGKPGVQVLSALIWISFWISWPHAAVLNFLIDPKVLLDIEC